MWHGGKVEGTVNGTRALIDLSNEKYSLIPNKAIAKKTIRGEFILFNPCGVSDFNWINIRETDRVEMEISLWKRMRKF